MCAFHNFSSFLFFNTRQDVEDIRIIQGEKGVEKVSCREVREWRQTCAENKDSFGGEGDAKTLQRFACVYVGK